MGCADNCHGEIPHEPPTFWGSGAVRASLVAWVLVIAGLCAWWAKVPPLVPTILYALAIVSGGFYFAREGVEELFKEREVGIEFLMTGAIVGAAALGGWREAALVAALYSITEALEGFTIQRTRYAIRKLMDLVPPKAHVLRDGMEREMDVAEVVPGDRVQVRPGESIPLDGVVREGHSAVNESAITGESLPADRKPGDSVYAGTLNGEGALLIEVAKRSTESTVAKIIELVERAQAEKGRSQLFVEKFGKVYSPAILGTAILLAVVPWLLGLDARAWALKAVSFLVAASPCALAVATPVTLVAAIGSAARKGVLIKGGAVLETLGRVKAIALDKTGTLTFGTPELRQVYVSEGSEDLLLRLAAAVEHYSDHPIARSIVRAAEQRKLSRPTAEGFRSLTGAGVQGRVEGRDVMILKPAAARERGIVLPEPVDPWLKVAEDEGHTSVVVAVDGRFVGLLAVADTVRPEARTLVRDLERRGICHVAMLTGDNPGTARAIAAQAGITEVHAGLLPEEKVARVAELRKRCGEVAMIGDGVNDAPALAAASVGIAMGAAGSDAAIGAADIALMKDDLSKLEYVLGLGRRSRAVIRQNIVAAMAIVAVLVAGTLVGDLGMLGAVLGHEGSEVLIILNGLRVALK